MPSTGPSRLPWNVTYTTEFTSNYWTQAARPSITYIKTSRTQQQGCWKPSHGLNGFLTFQISRGSLSQNSSPQGWPFNKESFPSWKNIQQIGHTAKPSSKQETSAPCVKIQNSKGSFILKIINTRKGRVFSKKSSISPEKVPAFGKCPQFKGKV